jgi:hypothetical protein
MKQEAPNVVMFTGITRMGDATATELKTLYLDIAQGARGDKHYNTAAALDARLHDMFKEFKANKGSTQLANWRQVTVVSMTDLAAIQQNMQLPGALYPGLLAENIAVDYKGGNFSKIGTGNILVFTNNEGEMTSALWVMAENVPCGNPGANIAKVFNDKALANKFESAAQGLRGLVTTVFVPGVVKRGYKMHVRPLLLS